MIDFKQRKVQLCGYSIMSYSGSINWAHLKNWKLEGSNDENNWITIDKRENNFDLNDKFKIAHFPITGETQPFRYIQIKVTGPTCGNTSHLCLCRCEFFGKLIETP